MRLKAKQCRNKIKHASEQSAMEHLVSNHGNHPEMNAYKCPGCDGWHVGHKPLTPPEVQQALRDPKFIAACKKPPSEWDSQDMRLLEATKDYVGMMMILHARKPQHRAE